MAFSTKWFRSMLRKRPILVNTFVYGTFYTAAEISQQNFNIYRGEASKVDYASASRIAVVGSCIYAPTLYYWYRLLDQRFPGAVLKATLTKVALDQAIMTPILLAAFYTMMGVVEKKGDVFEELRAKFTKTFLANQAFWVPAQLVNFSFVQPHLRVVYVATASFLWINVLCFIKRQKLQD